ncbi:MAG TPA: hypothetical protein VJ464_22585 [Blastocatellia bacterium]|nr:hypothetical protein [Blastocatellia bacterium]
MKLEDSRENYYFFTGKVSDIVRQLGLAGIGLVWVFKIDVGGRPVVPPDLATAAKWIVIGLGFDLLQYVYGALAWGIYNRYKEKSDIDVDTEFTAPPQINWPTNTFFWLKVGAILTAYVYILKFLATYIG